VEVYGDILFLINMGMDALCLLLTAKLLHIPQGVGRWMLASALGGVYAVAALFLEVGQPWGMVLDLGVCCVMCLVAFGKKKSMVKIPLYSLVFMATSMVMGGMMTALYQLLGRAGVAQWLPGGDDGLSSVAFVLLAGLGGIFTHTWSRIFKKAQTTKVCTLAVTLEGKSVTLSAMVDIGNLLKDPMGGGVVIPVNTTAIQPILSAELQAYLEKQTSDDVLWTLPEAHRLRLIPTHTATGEGMLIAFRPDKITVTPEEKTPYQVMALIAPMELSAAPAEALIPSELLH